MLFFIAYFFAFKHPKLQLYFIHQTKENLSKSDPIHIINKKIFKRGPIETHTERTRGNTSGAITAIWLPMSLWKNFIHLAYGFGQL